MPFGIFLPSDNENSLITVLLKNPSLLLLINDAKGILL